MKILLAVDESPHAREAVRWVAANQWPAGSTVRLVCSIRSDLYITGELYAPAAAELEDLLREETTRTEKTLKERGAELSARGLAVETRVMRGDPRFSILDEAKDWGAELIVVGSHGRSGLSRLFLGSVASHVVSHATCNVLVIKLPKP